MESGGSERASGRLSLAVIALGAAVALLAGGAWWVSAAPEEFRRPPEVSAVVGVPEDAEVFPVPDESEIRGDPENALPIFDGALERTIQRLDPGNGIAVSIESKRGARYLLQYVCMGPGELQIMIVSGTDGTQPYEVGCAGSFSMLEVVGTGEPITINVFRPGSESADVGLQLIPAQ